jgi:hypothetical protein
MAFEYANSQSKISLAAGADLSAKQYHFVKLSGSGVVACSAVTDVPIGVLQNAPESGEVAEVSVDGITKLVAGGALSVGALLGTTTAGRGAALTAGTDTTKYVVGQVVTAAGANGDIITVTLDCKSPNRAA